MRPFILNVSLANQQIIELANFLWPRSTMDSIRVSEALDPRSIRGEATNFRLCILPMYLKV